MQESFDASEHSVSFPELLAVQLHELNRLISEWKQPSIHAYGHSRDD
jgi:hypothetical protein